MSDRDGHRLTDGSAAAVHLHLGDQAEQLLTAGDTPEMIEATKSLRLTALSVRRLLMGPPLEETSLLMDPSVLDPEVRRVELADLAVDVVTAADYLLRLLVAPAVTTPRLVLADATGVGRGSGYSDEETFDRLTRRRLDARGATVRLGMRLLSELHSGVASG